MRIMRGFPKLGHIYINYVCALTISQLHIVYEVSSNASLDWQPDEDAMLTRTHLLKAGSNRIGMNPSEHENETVLKRHS